MRDILVQIVEPEQLTLRVTAEATVAQWQEITRILDQATYYGPLHDFIRAIRDGIANIQRREEVRVIPAAVRAEP